MRYLVFPATCLAGLGLLLAGFAQGPKAASSEYPTASVRKEQNVVVDGVSELWRLQWITTPEPACGPRDDSALICPCAGFAYGEAGALDLVRLRDGAEIGRLLPAPPFAAGNYVSLALLWVPGAMPAANFPLGGPCGDRGAEQCK